MALLSCCCWAGRARGRDGVGVQLADDCDDSQGVTDDSHLTTSNAKLKDTALGKDGRSCCRHHGDRVGSRTPLGPY